MRRPLIGITCNYDFRDVAGLAAQTGLPGQQWQLLSEHYLSAVERGGGAPVILPICSDFETVKSILETLDGVILSGGNDVAPACYGERIKSYCGTLVPRRDEQEINMTRYIIAQTDIPLLGICRGIQVLNVAAGGTLYQDLSMEGGYEQHYCEMSPVNNPIHEIDIMPDSHFARIWPEKTIWVNSYHHQAVKDMAPGFKAAARSKDGVIEAMECDGSRYLKGVQWHPEMMYDSEIQLRVFKDFVKVCNMVCEYRDT